MSALSLEVNYQNGVEAIKAGRYVEALHFLSKAAFLSPSEPMPLIARGEAYAHLGDLRSAASNYRKALSMLGDTTIAQDLRWRLAQLLDALAVVTFREGSVDAAIRLVNEALEETAHPGIELHKATFLASRGDFEHAEPITQELVAGCTKSIEPEATVLLCRILIAYRRDFAKAKELLEKAVEMHSTSHPQIVSARTLFETAMAKYRSVAESTLNIEQLSRCIKAFPEDADLYRIRALAYTSQVDYKAAVQDLFTCLSMSQGSNAPAVELMVTVLATIGDELAETRDYPSAVYYYTEGLKWATTDTSRSQVLIARGDCQLALDKHEEALGDFKTVLGMDPNSEHAQARLGHLHDVWGSVLYNEGKYDLAEIEYTRAVEYCDSNPQIFYHRALTRAQLGKDAMMVRDLLSCRNLGVTDPRIVAMVNQFCVESGSAETSRMREEDMKFRDVEKSLVHATTKAEEEKRRLNRLTRTKGPDFNVGSLRSTHRDDLDGGVLTPANIRKFVGNLHSCLHSERTYMQTSAITGRRTLNGRDTRTIAEEEKRKPKWGVTQKKVQSRLDKIDVSKPTPIPQAYRYGAPQDSVAIAESARYTRRSDVLEGGQLPTLYSTKPGSLQPRVPTNPLDSSGPILSCKRL